MRAISGLSVGQNAYISFVAKGKLEGPRLSTWKFCWVAGVGLVKLEHLCGPPMIRVLRASSLTSIEFMLNAGRIHYRSTLSMCRFGRFSLLNLESVGVSNHFLRMDS